MSLTDDETLGRSDPISRTGHALSFLSSVVVVFIFEFIATTYTVYIGIGTEGNFFFFNPLKIFRRVLNLELRKCLCCDNGE